MYILHYIAKVGQSIYRCVHPRCYVRPVIAATLNKLEACLHDVLPEDSPTNDRNFSTRTVKVLHSWVGSVELLLH